MLPTHKFVPSYFTQGNIIGTLHVALSGFAWINHTPLSNLLCGHGFAVYSCGFGNIVCG